MQSLIEQIPKDLLGSMSPALLPVAFLFFALLFKQIRKAIAGDFEFYFRKGTLLLRRGKAYFKATWGNK